MRTALLLITIAYGVMLVTVTHLPPSKLPATGVSDKLEHILGYGLLAVLVSATVRAYLRRVPFLAIAVALAAFGAVDEVTQPLVGRTADVWDWVADVGGIVLGTGAVWALNCVRNACGE
jgi:VanZ family protein